MTRPESTSDSIDHYTMGTPKPLQAAIDAYEKKLIIQALGNNQWHRGKAAADLSINRRTLFKKIKKHGIERSQNRLGHSQ